MILYVRVWACVHSDPRTISEVGSVLWNEAQEAEWTNVQVEIGQAWKVVIRAVERKLYNMVVRRSSAVL